MQKKLPFHPNTNKSDLLHRCIWLNLQLPPLGKALSTSLSGVPSSIISISSCEAGLQRQKLQINSPTLQMSTLTTGLLSAVRSGTQGICLVAAYLHSQPAVLHLATESASSYIQPALTTQKKRRLDEVNQSHSRSTVCLCYMLSKFSGTDVRYSNRICI